jgi:hypothetical protein
MKPHGAKYTQYRFYDLWNDQAIIRPDGPERGFAQKRLRIPSRGKMDVFWTNEMDSIFLNNDPKFIIMPTSPDDRQPRAEAEAKLEQGPFNGTLDLPYVISQSHVSFISH